MSLHLRLTLFVAGAAAVAVAAVSIAGYISAADEVYGEVDEFLEQVADCSNFRHILSTVFTRSHNISPGLLDCIIKRLPFEIDQGDITDRMFQHTLYPEIVDLIKQYQLFSPLLAYR